MGVDASSTFTAILADVGGGTTDIAVVNDGGVEGTKMFGIGGRSYTRTIASDLDISFEDAEKLKIALSDENLKPEARRKIEKSIDKTLEVWLGGAELALGEFDAIDHLPNRILLCGGGASLEKLVEALETSEWYENLPFTRKPSVHHIAPDQVAGIIDQTGKVNDHTYITAMGLLRVGYDTTAGTRSTEGIKETFNRILSV